MIVEMTVPEVGESIQEVEIAQWLKQEGEWVEQDEDLVEVDSEKASLPLPAPASGRLVKILKRLGETVAVGDVIAEIDDAAQREQAEAGAQPVATEPPPSAPPTHQQRAEAAEIQLPKASVQAETDTSADPQPERRTAEVQPEGRSPIAPRRVAESPDVQAPPERQPVATTPKSSKPLTVARSKREATPTAPQPVQSKPLAPTTSTAREEELVPMTMIRRRIAARLVEAQQNSALLTTFNEIDMSAVIKLRTEFRQAFQEQHGVKLGFMSFFIKAAIEALKEFPEVNAEVRGTDVLFHNYYDIAIAIGGGRGLVVPVLRDADQMSFAEVESAIVDFANRAETNKLKPDELTGGTFTISNGGVYGSLLSTPIVNPPQSGVLGMHAIQDRPVARDGQVVILPMMYVALTYDHRIVDGREAVGFLRRIKELVEQPSRILLEV
jgi:2-oxoglutarate dehydrogenase E2 component (dihydrolipoamide succinyltransferase)